MTHKQHRGTSLILDRQFRSVGRIKRSTGTDDPTLYRLLDGMVGTLYKGGRIDVLQAIQRGRLTLLEVWARYRVGELDRLPTVETMQPLRQQMEAWVEKADTGTWNRASRRYAVRAILRLARQDATLDAVPDLLRNYASTAAGPTMFNRTRSACQAFLRDTVGKSHPLYTRVLDVRPRRIRTRVGNPQSPEAIAELASKLEPAYGEIVWAMALTGMGPGELWGRWSLGEDRIHIVGTKRQGRVRDIPLIRPIARPTRLYPAFRRALKDVTTTVLPYDLRRTFAHWMETASIPRTRRKMYMGHGKTDVTDLYERHDVERYLIEDGEKLSCLISPTANAVVKMMRLV